MVLAACFLPAWRAAHRSGPRAAILSILIYVRRSAAALELLARAETIGIEGAIDCQHAIQMIELVLQQFGERARSLDLPCRAQLILVSHDHPLCALDPYKQITD